MHYTVVVDLEMCNILRENRSKYHFSKEIIQIGATCLDENFEVVDGYNSYVRPQYGGIDYFIQKLTGINNCDLAKVQSLDSALKEFTEWLPDDVTMVSWSMSDRKQFVREMEEKQITNEKIECLFENWVDCQRMFAQRTNSNRQYQLAEALVAADIDYLENAHNGESDSYNTALLYQKMITQPVFRLNDYYEYAKDTAKDCLTSSFGDFFTGLDLSSLEVA